MPMKLDGSCQCGGVEFTLQSQTPVPYQLCACSICRKVGGYSGSVNLGGIADSLKVLKGQDLIKYVHPVGFTRFPANIPSPFIQRSLTPACRKYNAIKDRGTPNEKLCSSERNFCSNCSTMLWLWDHHWPELIHPFASAIDTELPEPAEMVCVMESSKPTWVRWPEGKKSTHTRYNKESLEEWHKNHGYFVD
ncbi:putative glutathione-dependent formaldehyde-activating enzyme [Penicillium rolfsii]|nr:putative glutathione-dependent formaldehyde-activating enzyme [Penicillium rolfsii]